MMRTTMMTRTTMGTVLTTFTLDLAMENFNLTYLTSFIGGIHTRVSVSDNEFYFISYKSSSYFVWPFHFSVLLFDTKSVQVS